MALALLTTTLAHSHTGAPPCSSGYIQDCADDECIDEGWVGDSYCDGPSQQWGADLCCYNNDGGDCNPEECGFLKKFCGDGFCDEGLFSCLLLCASMLSDALLMHLQCCCDALQG